MLMTPCGELPIVQYVNVLVAEPRMSCALHLVRCLEFKLAVRTPSSQSRPLPGRDLLPVDCCHCIQNGNACDLCDAADDRRHRRRALDDALGARPSCSETARQTSPHNLSGLPDASAGADPAFACMVGYGDLGRSNSVARSRDLCQAHEHRVRQCRGLRTHLPTPTLELRFPEATYPVMPLPYS